MTKHTHKFKKYFEGEEIRKDDVFGIGFTPKMKSWTVKYKCKCGKTQEFVNALNERPDMPEEIVFKK
jgi:hypothetical protein